MDNARKKNSGSNVIFANLSKKIKKDDVLVDIEFYIPDVLIDIVMRSDVLDKTEKRASILFLSGLYRYRTHVIKRNGNDRMPILSKTLKKTLEMYGIKNYKVFISKLIGMGLVSRGDSYTVKLKPREYRLLQIDNIEVSKITLSRLNHLCNKANKKVILDFVTNRSYFMDTSSELYKATIAGYKEYEFDIDGIRELLKNVNYDNRKKYQEEHYQKAIKYCEDFNELASFNIDDEYPISNPSKARIYSPFHTIPSIYKKEYFKRRDGKPFYSLDITNSQPAFLLSLITKYSFKIEPIIKSSIRKGTFYEIMGKSLLGYDREAITKDNKIRKIVKNKIFTVLYDRMPLKYNYMFKYNNGYRYRDENINEYGNRRGYRRRRCYKSYFIDKNPETPTLRKEIFIFFLKLKKKYPLFALSIIRLTKMNNGIAALMQKLEASVILKIATKYNLPSVHDCVYVEEDRVQEVYEALMEELRNNNVICKISSTLYDKN